MWLPVCIGRLAILCTHYTIPDIKNQGLKFFKALIAWDSVLRNQEKANALIRNLDAHACMRTGLSGAPIDSGETARSLSILTWDGCCERGFGEVRLLVVCSIPPPDAIRSKILQRCPRTRRHTFAHGLCRHAFSCALPGRSTVSCRAKLRQGPQENMQCYLACYLVRGMRSFQRAPRQRICCVRPSRFNRKQTNCVDGRFMSHGLLIPWETLQSVTRSQKD